MIDRFPQKFYKYLEKGAKIEIKTNVKENSFGDGYVQRIKSGLNNERIVLNVNFKGMSEKDFQELKNFLLPKINFLPILFTYSKEPEKQYIVRSFSGKNNNIEPCEVELQLEQDFSL